MVRDGIHTQEVTYRLSLVPKLLTMNDLERRNGRYVALFHPALGANYVKVVEARSILSYTSVCLPTGQLKMREWKMQE